LTKPAKQGINRIDRIDRIKEEMQKDEGGMMNNKQFVFHSSFILLPSALLLSCLSCPSCSNPPISLVGNQFKYSNSFWNFSPGPDELLMVAA
jgi:hypothetical protein